MKTILFYKVKSNNINSPLNLFNMVNDTIELNTTNFSFAYEKNCKGEFGKFAEKKKKKLSEIQLDELLFFDFYFKPGKNHFFTEHINTLTYKNYNSLNNEFISLVIKKLENVEELFVKLLEILGKNFEIIHAYAFNLENFKIPEVVCYGTLTPELSSSEIIYADSININKHIDSYKHFPMIMPIMYLPNFTDKYFNNIGIQNCTNCFNGVIFRTSQKLIIDDEYEKNPVFHKLKSLGLIKIKFEFE